MGSIPTQISTTYADTLHGTAQTQPTGSAVNRPVLDQTGLNGSFEFTLDWAIDDAPATNEGDALPSIFTALQEQLGLKLNSTKGPVETVVIDRADRAPSDN